MGLRIAVGGFLHETNTFVARPTTWRDFVEAGPWPTVTRGEGLFDAFRGLNLGISHAIAGAREAGHAVLPLAWGCAMPGGRVEDEAFDRMSEWLVEDLSRTRPDAVYLELHGAMVTQGHDDGEGELLRRVRSAVGRTSRSSCPSTCTATSPPAWWRWPISPRPTAPIRTSTGAPRAGAAWVGSTV
jgi:microcystin degradation protein MlrC